VCLSPDIVWLTLMQGLAHHVNQHAEKLRKHFVSHDGKLTLIVVQDDFVMGSEANRWPVVFSTFSRAIHDYIGDKHRLIVADFSTTTALSRAASEVALLDTVQSFFSFEVHTRCGIPTITLEGTIEDWRAISRRVRELRNLGLGFWVDALEPILEKFVATAGGHIDRAFWESIYKWNGPAGSGSPYVSGWIRDFFPYLTNPTVKLAREIHAMLGNDPHSAKLKEPPFIRNPWLGPAHSPRGPGRDDFPALPSRAPFIWNYLGREFPMQFVGGLVGVRQDPESLCLRPEIGWAILHSNEAP
jgi:hypothetical protein